MTPPTRITKSPLEHDVQTSRFPPTVEPLPADTSPWTREPDVDSTTGSEGGARSTAAYSLRYPDMLPQAGPSRPRWLSLRTVAVAQGLYYVPFGLWPLIHINSFMGLTGPKNDLWLVETVGALLAVVGAVLLVTGLRHAPSRGLALMGAGIAAVLALLDLAFVSMGSVGKIYLADAAAEGLLALWWTAAHLGPGRAPPPRRAPTPRPGWTYH
ncbi:MAG TPA: hypothetical protein VFH51_13330 [Myxococcota bacterium]|nr:hypothetical protein [Myxococcota bacterium]